MLVVLHWIMKAKRAKTNETAESSEIEEAEENRAAFADIAGYDTAKRELESAVSGLKNRDKTTGVLLYGSADTEKSMLAAAAAASAGVPLFAVSAKTYISKYAGYAFEFVKFLYQQARKSTPCVVFIDDIDAIGGAGEDSDSEAYRARKALLSELGDNNSGVLTIAATNRLSDFDPALLDRFACKIEISLPDEKHTNTQGNPADDA